MKAFFGGEWRETDASLPVLNPYTGEAIDEVPLLGAEHLDETFTTLRRGTLALAGLSRADHHAIFERFQRSLRARSEEIAQTISQEQGKCIKEATLEVRSSLNTVEAIADDPSLIGSRILPLAMEASSEGRVGYTVRHPHGIVAAICPNSQPFIIPLIYTLFGIAAGNSVALKPSVHTPLVALKLVEMLLEAGCPPEAIACLTGDRKSLGEAICRHPAVNHIACTGSLKTIRRVRAQMGMVTSQLQWGCVATCIVGKSAEIRRVVPAIVQNAFEASGQAAFTPTWIACFDQKHDELRDRLRKELENFRVGDPLDNKTQIGPLTEEKKVKHLEQRLTYELSHGAELVTGGHVERQLYRPILLDGCDLEKTRFSHEEIAAPIIGLTSIRRAKDAIDLIREQRHHVLTVFSNDEDWAARQAMSMPFNNVHINGIPTWRDGLICLPGNPTRTGRRRASDRIEDMCHVKDVIFH